MGRMRTPTSWPKLDGYEPACPECGAVLPIPTLAYRGEPVPDGVLCMENVEPLRISSISTTCENGHAWTATEHRWDLAMGRTFAGLQRIAGR